MDRQEAIQRIRKGLQQRSGKAWSVKGGRGTAYGWIEVSAPPARLTAHSRQKQGHIGTMPEDYEIVDTGEPNGYMTEADRKELAGLLGLERVHIQGINIAASTAYRLEYVARAEGRVPDTFGTPYWD